MTTDQFRALWKAEPFTPFTLHLASGQSITVDHPALVSRGGRTASIATGDESFAYVDLLLVENLTVGENGKGRRG